jgi:hypothetical protein
MATIDIVLPAELMAALTPPVCADLQLPPIATQAASSLQLPIGGTLNGVADFTRGIPTDCSMGISLMVQLAPIMASMECLLNVLSFLSGIVSAASEIPPNPIDVVNAIVSGASDLLDCFKIVVPGLPLFCFIVGVLRLIANLLLCMVDALESTLGVMSGIQIQMADAEAAGNTDLMAALQCANENAIIAADGTMQSLQPITVLLSLIQPFLKLAKLPVPVLTFPPLVASGDLAAMQAVLQPLRAVAQDISAIADTIKC